MLYLMIAGVVLVLLVGVRFYRLRGSESVDLRDREARRRAAARWLSQGEGEQAEAMLEQAVEVSEGWDKALALVDLASLYAASERDPEAAASLRAALDLADSASDWEELFELRVHLAQSHSRLGELDRAREVLETAIELADDGLALGLAEEAYAEFLLRHGELEKARLRYQSACAALAAADHDRAAVAVARNAYLLSRLGEDELWPAFASLSHELQLAVPLALGHLLEGFEAEHRAALVGSFSTLVAEDEEFAWEREQLEKALQTLAETPL